ncbi:MAG: hypothetical protein GY847_10310 [Proteobacteria bacterium]|nr:hypothetical protein [Pseudomonadota bacterium]
MIREASTRRRFGLNRSLLPSVESYFTSQNMELIGRGIWRSTLCPFHNDTRPSLRINIESGGYRCMSCGMHGRDVIDFHRARYGLQFKEACADLRAWEVTR